MSTTSNLSNSVRARYLPKYFAGVMGRRVYDQLAMPIADPELMSKSQDSAGIVLPYLSDMGISAQTISETVDIAAQILRDTTATISKTSRADAIQDSEKLLLQAYTDYGARRFNAIGKNMMETIEAVVLDHAMTGANVVRPAARASLDAGTTTHYLTELEFYKVGNRLKEFECPEAIGEDGIAVPNGLIAIVPPDAYVDLVYSDHVLSVAEYQNQQVLFNGEIGSLNGFRIIVSPFAKVFGAAGSANGSAVSTTLAAAGNALSKTIQVAASTNLESGRYLTIGTAESGSTLYPENERVAWVSDSSLTATIIGRGPNGGLKFDHAIGTAVSNADSVYPVLFGGPMSLVKAFDSSVGEFGEVVGPKRDGLVDQFVSLGWKWYGGYGIVNENWLVRGEYASSLDA